MYIVCDINKTNGTVLGLGYVDNSWINYYIENLYENISDTLFIKVENKVELGFTCLNYNVINSNNYQFDNIMILESKLWNMLSDEEKNRTDILYFLKEDGETHEL